MIKILKKILQRLFSITTSPREKYLDQFDIKTNDVVIDLGANIGQETLYFLQTGANVYAYEPNPYAFDVLKKRASKLPQFASNAHLFKAAVSDKNGKMKLWLHEEHSGDEIGFSQGSSLNADKNNVSSDFVEVNVIDIKDVLNQHSFIKLLKIDIEGGEYDIIETILDNAEKIETVLLETHGDKNEAFRQKEERLQRKIKESPYKERFRTDWI